MKIVDVIEDYIVNKIYKKQYIQDLKVTLDGDYEFALNDWDYGWLKYRFLNLHLVRKIVITYSYRLRSHSLYSSKVTFNTL